MDNAWGTKSAVLRGMFSANAGMACSRPGADSWRLAMAQKEFDKSKAFMSAALLCTQEGNHALEVLADKWKHFNKSPKHICSCTCRDLVILKQCLQFGRKSLPQGVAKMTSRQPPALPEEGYTGKGR